MDMLKAIYYAEEMHRGQKRKDGTPYFMHPVIVSAILKDQGYEEAYQIAGLFHDLLEDTDATEEEILALSDQEVLEAVKLLTKKKSVPEDEYIKAILQNPMAKAVKNADRINNLTDAFNTKISFIRRYLADTKAHYLGKFSKELDRAYEELDKASRNMIYTFNGVVSEDMTVYRSVGDRAWYFDTVDGIWVREDPYFWADLGDDAMTISEEDVRRFLKKDI